MSSIHIISELYYPEQNATGYFLTGIAEVLVEPGSDVRVICAQPSYNQRGEKALTQEVRNGVSIRRCWSTTCDPRKIIGRLMNFATVTLSISWRSLWKIRKGDRVLVVTNPPLLPFTLRLVCWLKRAKFVLLVHDVYPDVFVPLGLMKDTALLYRVMSWLNGKLYAASDSVVALGGDMADLVRIKSGQNAKVKIIPNWGDVDMIRPEPKDENVLLKKLSLEDKFVVHYSGNHGRTHDLVTIIEAARILESDPSIHFLFIGEGSGKAEAEGVAKEYGLSNVSFIGFVDRSELNTSLNASDVSLISFKSGMAGISVPSRLYNLMAAGKPIIAVVDNKSEVANVLNSAQNGDVIAPGKPESLAQAIQRLQQDPIMREKYGTNSRNEALDKYSREAVQQKFRELFESL